YNLSDAPGFDDDITITGSQYSTNATGNAGNPGPVNLAGSGPWTLATNQNINAGATQTYTIPVDVTVSLAAGSGGDNVLKSCGQAVPGIPRVGEGLFNRSLLDLDRDGTPDRQDSVCADLPYIVHEKFLVSTTQTGARTFKVIYKIEVKNLGTTTGTYGLADAPQFDNDIDIIGANYTSDVPGFTGPTNLAGSGPWTLSTNVNIAAGAKQTYNLSVDVEFDLSTSTGDKVYYHCGRANPNGLTAGEGLFNESRLDLDKDGIADMRDTVCADLPYVEHEKFFTSVTKTGLGLYTVKYRVDVRNRGGAIGQYDLKDNPGPDDDFEILNANYTSTATGHPANPGPLALAGSGPWVLSNDQTINPGALQTYNLTMNVRIDLQTAGSAGDEIYKYCGTSLPGVPSKGEGLFNESTLDVNNDGNPDQRDSVCRDVEIVDLALRKKILTAGPYSYYQKLTFQFEVINQGNVSMSSVEISDYVPAGYQFIPADNPGWTGVLPTISRILPGGPLAAHTSRTVNVVLQLIPSNGGAKDWINYGEIVRTIDLSGNDRTADDEDSNPGSDGTGERAVYPGDPADDNILSIDKGGEEDDHDPVGIEVYDLALRKVYKGSSTIHYNDVIPFEITLFNQGNRSAQDIAVVDYIPVGYDWVVAPNVGWTYNNVSRMASYTYGGKIIPGDSAKLTIYLKVLVNYSGVKAWDNYSEIKSSKDTTGLVRLQDIDSKFDMISNNDNGGVPDTNTDNHISDDGNDGNGDGIKDEDDHDPARPSIVDLALRKWIFNKKSFYLPGENVPYILSVYNQGNTTMSSVTVRDSVRQGYVFLPGSNPGWSQTGNFVEYTHVGSLVPGDSAQIILNLQVTIAASPTIEDWWNYGEIKSAKDSDNKDRSNDDADSKPNSNSNYENLVKPGDPWDNIIDGQGQVENEDEDDNDPEEVKVTGALGDKVWKDLDGDGIQDPGEPGIPNVVAILYDCATGSILKKDTTDVNGNYLFDFLIPLKSYFVSFVNPDPVNCGFTFDNRGIDDKKDSDVNATGVGPCTFIEPGERDSTYDAGLVSYASYGDYVWHDKNGNGMQEVGEEGVSNVKVTLYDANTNLPIRTTITDGNGYYKFEKLYPGNYYAKFEAPAGWTVTDPNLGPDFKDSDVDGSNGPGTNATTYLSPGEDDLTWDLGLFKCIMIGGRVFYDRDIDGIFDYSENGINGLEVYLINAMTGAQVAKLKTAVNPATPSDDGYYKFPCVRPGMYYVKFERPGHLAASDPLRGTDRNKDSDIGHENGLNTSRKLTVVSGDMLLNIGAGFSDKAVMGDFVWLDANGNGVQDSGEEPIENVHVYAVSPNGTIVSESMTQPNGTFNLDGIAQGDYYVRFEPPSSYGFTTPKAGSDPIDSDVDGTNGYGTTRTYRINAGDEKPTVDAGLVFQVLPLEWLSFDGRYNGSFTELDWSTGVEINNDYFDVERRHESEAAFSKIAQVDASSDRAAKIHTYNHDDYDVSRSGIYYYRIKQVDRNGTFSYSKTISIKVQQAREMTLSIYPNPTDESLTIDLGLADDGELEVRVFDEAGKNVLTNPFGGFRKAGFYREAINTSIFAIGQYNLQIKTATGLINKKFTVAR
ncbi:MAG: DUF11 domain-containing protein, partial [Saprospiraceae bacterium]|nr:DUF11 domain-containing protein [Saprospiraceae bacterium]